MATACWKPAGLAMLSVTLPDLARIVLTLNFSPVLAAESLYVLAGRAGAPDASAALPTPIATTTAPAMILLLRTFMPSIRTGLGSSTQNPTRGFRGRAAPR